MFWRAAYLDNAEFDRDGALAPAGLMGQDFSAFMFHWTDAYCVTLSALLASLGPPEEDDGPAQQA